MNTLLSEDLCLAMMFYSSWNLSYLFTFDLVKELSMDAQPAAKPYSIKELTGFVCSFCLTIMLLPMSVDILTGDLY